MSTELLSILLTLGIAAFGVLIYLWTAGSSLIRALEIHTLRVDAHALRLEYARRIAELAGESTEDTPILVDIVPPENADSDPSAAVPDSASASPASPVTTRAIGAGQPARAAA